MLSPSGSSSTVGAAKTSLYCMWTRLGIRQVAVLLGSQSFRREQGEPLGIRVDANQFTAPIFLM